MRWIGRSLLIVLALLLLASGGLALGVAFQPEHAAVDAARQALFAAAEALADSESLGLPEDLPSRAEGALRTLIARFALAPAGLVLLVFALLPGRGGRVEAPVEGGNPMVKVDARSERKGRRQASAIAKKGQPLEAAEYCLTLNLVDDAAGYFIQAGEFERAAELRHDQNRFVESAELYMKAGRCDSAGSIFAQQEEYVRAAEAYLQMGNTSVAAEMFEKAEDPARAADAYADAGFPRHAAKNYVKAGSWERAAVCLEQTVLEESTGAAVGDARKQAEIQKLVRMTADLYQRAGDLRRAEAVLVRGECHVEAAELALKGGREAEAAELLLRGKQPERAAQVLRGLGKTEDAARILAEYHRDQGDHEKAAAAFEEAGDHMSAGDTYRLIESYAKAAECYERMGESAQAAEMHTMAGDRARAAACYEQAGLFAEAAECFALAGDGAREAELLSRAGNHLRAGEIHLREGRADDAIAVLQQVEQGHDDFAQACAMLGELFRDRGMHSLAAKKLELATEGRDISRETVRAFYTLATLHEATGRAREAVELYEKILAFDIGYEDASERVEAARAVADREVEESGSAMGGSTRDGRYRITGKLGRGGMGIVYKAQDTVLDRTVAFKVLPEALKENPQALKNFLREAKSAAKLNHPNIVTVYDAGEQDGVYYIAMEYVDGHTLKEIIKQRGPISAAGIVHVVAQMAEALAYAHEKKVVHRDIKSANAMWTKERKAKIMDFGLAKVLEEVRNHTTVVSGTPYYMSPEQTLGKNVDHRTDIYSLGVTVFEMATGTLPFREGNLPYHHVHTPPPDPRELNERVPELIANIVARCLKKDPAERYQSALEILAEIKSSLAG